jgi:predicted AAA+ superfamily ATPase
LNKADLARDVGISPTTANHWLSTLEASGQIALLEPWFSKRTKFIIKGPKLYLADRLLLCALKIQSEGALRQSPAAGAVWETFVFAQLRNHERRAGKVGSLLVWRDCMREVDFVVDVAGRLELLEAKWAEVPTVGDTVNLDFVHNVFGKSGIASLGREAMLDQENTVRRVARRVLKKEPDPEEWGRGKGNTPCERCRRTRHWRKLRVIFASWRERHLSLLYAT